MGSEMCIRDSVTPEVVAASKGQRSLELRLQYLATKILHGESTADKGWQEHSKEEVKRTQGKMAAAVTKELQKKAVEKAPTAGNRGGRGGGRGRGRRGGRGQGGQGGDSNKAKTISKASETDNPTPSTSGCLLYTSPSPRDLSTSRMPSSA